MAQCPFAIWLPISGPSGAHAGGPFKIVHHTTEGSTAEGAMQSFRSNRSDPHFTVDATRIFQHVDTAQGARALRNAPGGIETNRDSAVQIELVAFAHLPKDRRALANLARLCRWIEATHQIPLTWPAGLPRPAKNGKDPGGHNRDPQIWDSQGGHYGHCHVPENVHWDPGYTRDEVDFIMQATFNAQGALLSGASPSASLRADRAKPATPAGSARRARSSKRSPRSTMPDHGVAHAGTDRYISDLVLGGPTFFPVVLPARRGARKALARKASASGDASAGPGGAAKVDVGSVISFVDGLSRQEMDDVLYSVQLAQRAASGSFDRFTQAQSWYQKYVEILQNLGWANSQFAFTQFDQSEGEFRMDKAALAMITAIATQNQLAILQQAVTALSNLAEEDGAIRLFDFHSSLQGGGNFQLGAVQRSQNGALSMALGAFYFRSLDERRRFLFFKWGSREVHFWTAAQRMTLNADFYARRRKDVLAKLDADADQFISGLQLGSR